MVKCGLSVLFFSALVSASEVSVSASPVEKVITMLEDLQVSIVSEGKAESKTYNTFACFCKDTTSEKNQDITDGQATVDTLMSTIGTLTTDRQDLDDQISEYNEIIQQAEKEMAHAKKTRHKENEEFMVLEAELAGGETNLHAASKEIKVMSTVSLVQLKSFLSTVRQSAKKLARITGDRFGLRSLGGLLQFGEGEPEAGNGAALGELLDTVEDLEADFSSTLEDTRARENKAITEHDHFMDRKRLLKRDTERDLKDAQEAKGGKMESIATNQRDLTSTAAVLADDRAYLLELSAKCDDKAAQWNQRSRVRTDELTALSTALNIIKERAADKETHLLQVQPRNPTPASDNKDEEAAALHEEIDEILAGEDTPTFLQLGSPRRQLATLAKQMSQEASKSSSTEAGPSPEVADALKERVVALLRSQSSRLGSATLASLATSVSADPFAKVKKLVQELVERLLQEAADEASHKGWCDKELGKARQRRKLKTEDIKKLNSELSTAEAKRDKLQESIHILTTELAELSSSLGKMTKERQAESAENAAAVKQAEEGKQAIEEAITVLDHFYKTADKELFIQKAARTSTQLHDEPDAGFDDNYKGDQAASGGILGMMDVIKSDFERTIKETEAQEKLADKDFLEFQTTTKVSIGTKTVGKEAKEAELTATRGKISEDMQNLRSEQDQLDKTIQELGELRPACLDSGMSYEEKVAKREQEIESLKQALCILSQEPGQTSDC